MRLLRCQVQDRKLLPHPFHAASCTLSTKASLAEPLGQHQFTPAWEELPSGFKTFLYPHTHVLLQLCFQALLIPTIKQTAHF